jgi:hypothetical protein
MSSLGRALGTIAGMELRDGQHDFDFAVGSWKVHLSRLPDPLSGTTEWIEYEGTSVCRPVWDGRANGDEFRVTSPTTGALIDGLTLRLYNPATAEWSLYWANASNGALSLPPTVGRFADDGSGAFFDEEEIAGRQVLVRYFWSDITRTPRTSSRPSRPMPDRRGSRTGSPRRPG